MERGNRKSRIGVVVSNKMTKTVVVRVDLAAGEGHLPGVRPQGVRPFGEDHVLAAAGVRAEEHEDRRPPSVSLGRREGGEPLVVGDVRTCRHPGQPRGGRGAHGAAGGSSGRGPGGGSGRTAPGASS